MNDSSYLHGPPISSAPIRERVKAAVTVGEGVEAGGPEVLGGSVGLGAGQVSMFSPGPQAGSSSQGSEVVVLVPSLVLVSSMPVVLVWSPVVVPGLVVV